MLEWVDHDGVPEFLELNADGLLALEGICRAPTGDGGALWALVLGKGTPGFEWVIWIEYQALEDPERANCSSADRLPSLEEIQEAVQFMGTSGAVFAIPPFPVEIEGKESGFWVHPSRVTLRQVGAAVGSVAGIRWALGGGQQNHSGIEVVS